MFDHADSTEPLTEESCGQGRQSDRRNLSFRRLHAGALWSPAYLSLCRTYQLHRSGITDDQRGVDLTLGEGFIGMIGDSTESIWSLPKERFEAMPRKSPRTDDFTGTRMLAGSRNRSTRRLFERKVSRGNDRITTSRRAEAPANHSLREH